VYSGFEYVFALLFKEDTETKWRFMDRICPHRQCLMSDLCNVSDSWPADNAWETKQMLPSLVFVRTSDRIRYNRRIQILQSAGTCSRWSLARGFFYPEDGGDTFLRNVGSHKTYTAPHPRRRRSPHFLDLGISWRWVISVTPMSLYPRYPLDTRLGGPQSRSERRGEEEILDHIGTRTPTPWSSCP
jgi:hypothetical protein